MEEERDFRVAIKLAGELPDHGAGEGGGGEDEVLPVPETY